MRIFISSLIGGFEAERAAARSAVTTLRHEPVMAEDFGALPNTPQIACLEGVRSADLVVLILGARYGVPQGTSGVSPTHEEYNEARDSKPILMFVQEGVEREEAQARFVEEAQRWQTGHFRAGFRSAEELRDLVTRAIHDYQLANAAGPLDIGELSGRAVALLPTRRGNQQPGSPTLLASFAGGPRQQLIRAATLEAPGLAEAIHQRAMFGEPRMFARDKGVPTGIEGTALVLRQEHGASVQIDEQGAIVIAAPLGQPDRSRQGGFGVFSIIEEDVQRALAAAIAFAAWLLDHVDPTQRLAHVAIAASIDASDFMGWRTQAEQDASPNRQTMRMGNSERSLAQTDRSRAALRLQAAELAEDLIVHLRRQLRA